MENTKEQIDYNEIVGENQGIIYVLDYVFKHSDNFKGATGSTFRLVPKSEYDERMADKDYFKEQWIDAIKHDLRTDSFDDWLKYNDLPSEEAIFDLSYIEMHDKIRSLLKVSEKDYPIIECIGGGRCFNKNMKFDKVFNKKLIKVINEYEKDEAENDN